MSYCNHCDTFVSSDFIRVFGDKHGEVYACPNCSANAGIVEVSERRRGMRA